MRLPCRPPLRPIILALCRFATSRRPWRRKGAEFAREYLILEVCQPQRAKKMLEENMSVSPQLACRISIYEEGGETTLAALKSTALLAMFNTATRRGAQQVENTMVKNHKGKASG